jgi:pimeloyl-ACP methyl ester carboxylesterase
VTRRARAPGARRTAAGRPLQACPDLPAEDEVPPPPLEALPADRRETPEPMHRGLRALATRLGRDVRALATPTGVRGAVVESLWVTAHVATYPWGLVRERQADERYGYEGLRPLQRGLLIRDVEAAGTPILLLHGMIDNRAIFTLLTRRLRAHGFTRVRTLNYPPTTNDIRAAAENLAAEVEALVAESGHERIHVVGHSLGGLIARYYVQRLGGDARVRTLVTLGTPHHGTLAAHLVPARLGRQLRPRSDLFRELDLPAPGFATRIVAYWSDLDQLIVPHDNARLEHPDLQGHNVVVRGVGHLSLPITGRVVREVVQTLTDGEPPAGAGRLPAAVPADVEEITPA